MTDARAEIWESFISLLRAYAAGCFADTSSVTTSADGTVTLAYKDRRLRLGFESASGHGLWQLIEDGTESQGEFQMHIDSTLEFAEGPKALDLAAIDFIEQLSKSKQAEAPSTPINPAGTTPAGTTPASAIPATTINPATAAPFVIPSEAEGSAVSVPATRPTL